MKYRILTLIAAIALTTVAAQAWPTSRLALLKFGKKTMTLTEVERNLWRAACFRKKEMIAQQGIMKANGQTTDAYQEAAAQYRQASCCYEYCCKAIRAVRDINSGIARYAGKTDDWSLNDALKKMARDAEKRQGTTIFIVELNFWQTKIRRWVVRTGTECQIYVPPVLTGDSGYCPPPPISYRPPPPYRPGKPFMD